MPRDVANEPEQEAAVMGDSEDFEKLGLEVV